jgi:hypothetical protein
MPGSVATTALARKHLGELGELAFPAMTTWLDWKTAGRNFSQTATPPKLTGAAA